MVPSSEPDRRRSPVRSAWAPKPGDLDLLRLFAAGQTVGAMARRSGVSERTVRRRLRGIADDIGVDSAMEAVVLAVRRGLI